MSDTVIQIEGLWKEYRLGVIGHGTLTRDLQSWWARVRGKEDPNSKIQPMLAGQEKQIEGDCFWALRDINLEVKEGEILGIIGRNGAGKSTLLKLLSRVTAPTKGQIKIKGRIASLLEVGTGFHPELTGRENIFMNGAILGMSKQEIKSKLDEIIDFSGVEKFIDTPVKRYSSGMYVRLAFAVAAHLEPEILVVDEVLAVGDAEFQKKCLGKMGEVSRAGRTVLFVSHNMGAIEQLCSRAILLKDGKIKNNGEKIGSIISFYLGLDRILPLKVFWENKKNFFENQFFLIQKMWASTEKEAVVNGLISRDVDIYINIKLFVKQTSQSLTIGFRVYDEDTGNIVFVSMHTDENFDLWPKIAEGENTIKAKIPKNFLNEGRYLIEVTSSLYKKEWLLKPKEHDISIVIEIAGGVSQSPYWTVKRQGVVAPVLHWEKEN